MRTSPLGMRRRRRRAPHVLLPALALVVALGAACSDDGADDDTSPTTTSPATTSPGAPGSDPDESTTTAAPPEGDPGDEPGGSEPGATVPGDGEDGLTPEQARAQLEALVAEYRQAVAEAAAAGVLDERTLAGFSGAFTGTRAEAELQALQQAGVAVLNPAPPEVVVADVQLTDAEAGCAAGTATIDGISGFVTVPVETIQPYYFRLVPAADEAAAPAWRLDFLNFSTNGQPPTEASCG